MFGFEDNGAMGHGLPLGYIFLYEHLMVERRSAVQESYRQKDTNGQDMR